MHTHTHTHRKVEQFSSNLQQKQQRQRDFVLPGSNSMPRAISYEDFRKHRDHQLSSKKSTDSFSGIRKAKSDTDITMHSLKKKVDVSLALFSIR